MKYNIKRMYRYYNIENWLKAKAFYPLVFDYNIELQRFLRKYYNTDWSKNNK